MGPERSEELYFWLQRLLGHGFDFVGYGRFCQENGEPTVEQIGRSICAEFYGGCLTVVTEVEVGLIGQIFVGGAFKENQFSIKGVLPSGLLIGDDSKRVGEVLGTPFLLRTQKSLDIDPSSCDTPPIECVSYDLSGFLWTFMFDNRTGCRLFQAELRTTNLGDRGLASMFAGDYRAAVYLLREAADPSLLTALARCYDALGDTTSAQSVYELALKCRPTLLRGGSPRGIVSIAVEIW